MSNEGDLRVWHIPQIPMKPFRVPVATHHEAALVAAALIRYDEFLFRNNIRGEYASAGGIQRYSEDLDGELGEPGWIDVEEDDENEDI